MATEVESLIVRLGGDASQLVRAVDAAKSSVREFVSSTLSALGALGLSGFLHGAFEDFSEAEGIGLRLTAALEVNGRQVTSLKKDYEDFAVEMERLSTLEDDFILKMLGSAEAFGLTEEAAKGAVRDAASLAAFKGGSPESFLRFTQNLAQGNIALAMAMGKKLVPELRKFKTEAEFAAGAERLIAAGAKVMEQEVNTAAGQLKMLKRDFGNFKEELGLTVAEAILPFISGLRNVVSMVRSASPEFKKMAVQVLFVGVALLSIAPALVALKFFLAPFLTLPALLIAATAAVLYFTGAGRAALSWFGKQWESLRDSWEPAIQGMNDAIAAGDLSLAFEILWTQVKLTFFSMTQSLQVGWAATALFFRETWADAVADIRSAWNSLSINFQKSIPIIQELWRDLQSTITGRGHDMTDLATEWGRINREGAANQVQINQDRKRAIDEANKAAQDAVGLIGDRINRLREERDELLLDAEAQRMIEEAQRGAGDRQKQQQKAAAGKGGAEQSVQAAAFGSAEAATRLEAFKSSTERQIEILQEINKGIGDVNDNLEGGLEGADIA